MTEIWKDVPGYEGYYEVSDQGRVRSLDRFVTRPTSQGYLQPGRILRPAWRKGATNRGYKTINLCVNGANRSEYIHRLVALAFLSNPDCLPQINHKNGRNDDNSVENIEWCSPRDNQLHAHANGLKLNTPRGEACKRAKLSNEEVSWIRAWSVDGYSNRSIAESFGVDPSTVSTIKCGKSRKYG